MVTLYHQRPARQGSPWPLLALTATLAAPQVHLHAQPLPLDAEAEARIQRLADRVKAVIVNAATAQNATPANPPAARSRTEAPARPRPAAAVPKPSGPSRPSGSAPDTSPANLPALPASALPSPAEPANAAPTQLVVVQSQRPPVSLFDFEGSTSGFLLHAMSTWAVLPEHHLMLTDQAQQGQQALAVDAPEPAWLGVDLEEAVDFSELRAISYWLRADQPKPPSFAIKTGSQYDWCRLPINAMAGIERPGGRFVHYQADLHQAAQACRRVDLSDVRGIFWEVGTNTAVVLDNVALR